MVLHTDAADKRCFMLFGAVASIKQLMQLVQKFTVDADASVANLAALNALTQGMTFRHDNGHFDQGH